LLRCATREGQEENPLGGDAALEQMRDAIDQSAGLAGAGPRDDEERTVTVGCRRRLLGVQLRGKIARRPERSDSRSRGVNLEGVGHATGSSNAEREVTTAVRS